MCENRLELLISSCNNYSDLWDLHIDHLERYWRDRRIHTTIVTDSTTDKHYPGIEIFSAGDNLEMPQRLCKALVRVKSEYVLVTLDDYFIVNNVDNNKINSLLDAMDQNNIDYIRMFPIPKEKKLFDNERKLYWIDLERNYGVNLYPGIWRKSFLMSTFKENLNAWKYEVSLTRIAKETGRRCVMSRDEVFAFLDVIRKGKLLSKASKYLKKNGIKLDREKISYLEEKKLNLMFWTKKNLPRSLQIIIKRIMKKLGMHFFSEGI